MSFFNILFSPKREVVEKNKTIEEAPAKTIEEKIARLAEVKKELMRIGSDITMNKKTYDDVGETIEALQAEEEALSEDVNSHKNAA